MIGAFSRFKAFWGVELGRFGSSRGVFVVQIRAFFAQIGAFWVRFELVLNPGPKSMVS